MARQRCCSAIGQHGDLNIRSAYAHMLADALVSMGVALAGAVILWTDWLWLDPAVSIVVSAVIVLGTWRLLRHSLDMALHAVPPRHRSRRGARATTRDCRA